MPAYTAVLTRTKILQAVTERMEDAIGKLVVHHQKSRLKGGSTINLKLTITPEKHGNRFDTKMAVKVGLADEEDIMMSFYGDLDREGNPVVTEYNPNQRSFDQLEEEAPATGRASK